MTLTVFGSGSPFNTKSSKQETLLNGEHGAGKQIQVEVTDMHQEMAAHGVPEFLKVDVEGLEEAVFRGMTELPALISFEANLPGFAEESCRVARKLESMSASVRFTVGGSGRVPDLAFPMTAADLEALVTAKDAPAYLEIFARR